MRSRMLIIAGMVIVGTLATVAYLRTGLLNLPSVPDEVTASDAGLDKLERMKEINLAIYGGKTDGNSSSPVSVASAALAEIRAGEFERGVHDLQEGVAREPENLVLGNLLRVETFKLQREWLTKQASESEIALHFPDHLRDQPTLFFRDLAKRHPIREVKLQLALSLVDHMLLFPALEIKAPASVEAVEILSEVVTSSDASRAYYVPALYARGLNYLYRPFNLVWPEKIAAPPGASSADLSLAVAVGQKIGAGSDLLKAELSLSLGDAYAKEGKLSLARSWWQIANNLAKEDDFRVRVFTRLKLDDEKLSSSLEQILQQQMEDLDHPLSDLRFMWQ